MAHAHAHGTGAVHVHISPIRTYLIILASLFVLTGLTIAAYNIRLGELNLIVAIVIATIKATLVTMFFMHMRHEHKFNILVFLSSLLFAGIFLSYTLNDTAHRGEVDAYNGVRIDPRTGDWAAGTSPGLVAHTAAMTKAEAVQPKEAMQAGAGLGPAGASPEGAQANEATVDVVNEIGEPAPGDTGAATAPPKPASPADELPEGTGAETTQTAPRKPAVAPPSDAPDEAAARSPNEPAGADEPAAAE